MTLKFYMKGGHVIVAKRVKAFAASSDVSTGDSDGYKIEWEDGRKPRVFSLSSPDIVAITGD